jgi:hypothetical protein
MTPTSCRLASEWAARERRSINDAGAFRAARPGRPGARSSAAPGS